MTSPTKAERAALRKQLQRKGIRVVQDRGDNVVVEATAQVVERVFSTNVTVYAHARTQRQLFKCDGFVIPKSLGLVEMLVGLPELPLKSHMGPKRSLKKLRARSEAEDYGAIIPGFIRDLYNIPQTSFPLSSIGVVEFLDYSSYDKTELTTMLTETNNPQFQVPANQTIGPFAGDGLESVLDVQYGLTLARGGSVWFWTGERWLLDFALQVSATPDSGVPKVFSMSWGWPSNSMCAAESGPAQCQQGWSSEQYSLRVDSEFAKIAARGITLVGASGDQGAPGDNFYQCQPGLSDIMPASSLWVTAIGATQLGSKAALRKRGSSFSPKAQPYGAPICRSLLHPFGIKCADGSQRNEITCSYAQGALITSGGGFQAYLAMPAWQRTAVQTYLGKAKLPSSQYFNASNRGFPDVSALGHEYLVFDQVRERHGNRSLFKDSFRTGIARAGRRHVCLHPCVRRHGLSVERAACRGRQDLSGPRGAPALRCLRQGRKLLVS